MLSGPSAAPEQREALLLEEAQWEQEQRTLALAAESSPCACACCPELTDPRRQCGLLLCTALVLSAAAVGCAVQWRVAHARGPFGARRAANIVWEHDFAHAAAGAPDDDVWTLAREFESNSFAFLTDNEANVRVQAADGTLRVTPGLFTALGAQRTVDSEPPYEPEDVLRGACAPFPECSTFKVANCTAPRGRPGGCKATGGVRSAAGGMGMLPPVTSARLDTRASLNFEYGRLEIRARLPAADWLLTTIALRAADDSYGPWPLSGEVELVRARGNAPPFDVAGQQLGHDAVSSVFHYGENPFWKAAGVARAAAATAAQSPSGGAGGRGREAADADAADAAALGASRASFADGFHTFGIFWNETTIYTYVLREPAGDAAGRGRAQPAPRARGGPMGWLRTAWDGGLEPHAPEPVELRIADLTAGLALGDLFDGPLSAHAQPAPSIRDGRGLKPLPPSAPNPYRRGGSGTNAPFDKPFYLSLGVSVGETESSCPDPQLFGPTAVWCKPCGRLDACGMPQAAFWEHKAEWLPGWERARREDRLSLAVQWVRLWQ